MGDVAKETEARYCTDSVCIDAGVTWTESEYTYPERSKIPFLLEYTALKSQFAY